jgi:hypothetical protein
MKINQKVEIKITRDNSHPTTFHGIITEIHDRWVQIVNLPNETSLNERVNLDAPIVSIKPI